VQNNDTLMSLAARFDTTPSELTQLNRLKSRLIFPGQVLAVPDRSGNKEKGDGKADMLSTNTQDALSSIRPPLTGERGELRPPPSPHKLPRTPANSVDVERSLDRDCLEKFLKITVRHITDGQGVVAGVLLVTPNAVMFDPNVSDPLVIEHGPESYGVIAPMEYVVNGALYYDIAHMRVKDTNVPRPEIPKPEIYWGPVSINEESPAKDASLSKDTTFPELATTASQDDNDSSCSCGGDTRESSAFPKAFEHELLTPGGDVSPANTEGETSQSKSPTSGSDQPQQPQAVIVGDLTPIAEATQRQENSAAASLPNPPNLAQTQCDNLNIQDLAQTDTQQTLSSDINDKKRTTSVTFDLSQEEHGLPDSTVDDLSQESRKQKVLKRLSYPLSWMENLGSSEKENMSNQAGVAGVPPLSAPPLGSTERVSEGVSTSSTGSLDSSDPKQAGMLSNVFSGVSSGVSGVTNMLSRRTSLDFARRPSGSQGTANQPVIINSQQPQTSAAPTNNTATITVQQLSNSQQLVQQQKRAQYKDGPKFGLKSMVSMDDMPELFASFDKLIPKLASACDESPLYLCLRMGKPANRKIPKSTPIMSYGKKKMRPEYWFSIPKSRSDELYHFFQLWAQDIYGELNEEEITRRGFILLEEETDVWDNEDGEGGELGEGGIGGEITEMTKESWEVASMSEELRRALYSSGSLTSLDLEVFLPEILGETEIITDHVRKSMYKKLPARAQGYSWKLVFSTAQHGFSLNSLYRKMSEVDSPCMVFIQDTHQNVFGAVLSCSLHVSELFYGTGECFLFTFNPEFQVYPWTGENTFFVKGNNESLIIGGGDGHFGLWLDGDLYQGRTQSCKTFDNPPMTDSEDFVIKTVECWGFE
ncbi:unnamed protein product, partial [Meganyctiphanes norvegica]